MSGNRIMDRITEGQSNARTEGQKDRTTEGQGESSIAPLFQSGAITTGSQVMSGNRIMDGITE